MNDHHDEKLSAFLKANRPQAPEAPASERERVWHALGGARTLGYRYLAPAVAALLLIAMAATLQWRSRESLRVETEVDEAFSLAYLDEEGGDELERFITALAD